MFIDHYFNNNGITTIDSVKNIVGNSNIIALMDGFIATANITYYIRSNKNNFEKNDIIQFKTSCCNPVDKEIMDNITGYSGMEYHVIALYVFK